MNGRVLSNPHLPLYAGPAREYRSAESHLEVDLVGRFLWMLLPLLTAVALAERVSTAAVITGFTGDVRMQVAGAWRATEPFLPLASGTQLKLPKGASVSFCLMTGGRRVALSGPSTARVFPDKVVVLEGEPTLLHYQDQATRPSVPLPKNLDLERMGGRWRGEISVFVDPGQRGSEIQTHWVETRPVDSFQLTLATLDDERVIDTVSLPASTHEHVFRFKPAPGASYFVKIVGRNQGREISTTSVFRTLTDAEIAQLDGLQSDKEELLLGYLAFEAYEPALKLATELQGRYPDAPFLHKLIEALHVRTGSSP